MMNERSVRSRALLAGIGIGLCLVCSVPLFTTAAYAHHSTAAFDANVLKTISGTVTEVRWANPHTYIFIRVRDKDGSDHLWSIISGTPQLNTRNGWKKDDVKRGDKVVATINPERAGGPAGILYSIKLSDGRTLPGPREFLVAPKG